MSFDGLIPDRRPSPPDDGIDDRTPAEHALDAADAEIERLRAENAELRAELEALTCGVERVVASVGLRRSECQLFDCVGCVDCEQVDHG